MGNMVDPRSLSDLVDEVCEEQRAWGPHLKVRAGNTWLSQNEDGANLCCAMFCVAKGDTQLKMAHALMGDRLKMGA